MTPEALNRVLEVWGVDRSAIGRVRELLSEPDPAGVVPPPPWEEVADVAAYPHRGVGGVRFPDWSWALMDRRHPAVRAIWWHERQELEAYRHLGVPNPLRLAPGEEWAYWRAHARASWEEARYSEAWASVEGQIVPARAFLQTNPMRQPKEQPLIVSYLQHVWSIDVGQVPVLEFRQALAFYRAKELTLQDVERWLRS